MLAATNGPKNTNKIVGFEMQALPGKQGSAQTGKRGSATADRKGIAEGPVTGFPQDVSILTFSWSPDGRYVAVAVEEEDGIRLWLIDADNLHAAPLSDKKLNMFFGMGSYRWAPDSQSLLVSFVPEDRGPQPVENVRQVAPVVQESDGSKNPVRTYQDLLTDEFTERQFDYFATSALGFIHVPLGKVRMLGREGIITRTSFSPDGRYVMVTSLQRPYSYVVTYSSFPVTEIMDMEGKVVKELDRTELREFVYAGVNSTSPNLRSLAGGPINRRLSIGLSRWTEATVVPKWPTGTGLWSWRHRLKDRPRSFTRASLEWDVFCGEMLPIPSSRNLIARYARASATM